MVYLVLRRKAWWPTSRTHVLDETAYSCLSVREVGSHGELHSCCVILCSCDEVRSSDGIRLRSVNGGGACVGRIEPALS